MPNPKTLSQLYSSTKWRSQSSQPVDVAFGSWLCRNALTRCVLVRGRCAIILGSICPHRCQERLDAHDVHDAGEIVGQDVQRHLRGNPRQCLHQEVRRSHPGLDRAEGMLDRLASLTHLLWMLIEPALNSFKNVLILPSAVSVVKVFGTGLRVN